MGEEEKKFIFVPKFVLSFQTSVSTFVVKKIHVFVCKYICIRYKWMCK